MRQGGKSQNPEMLQPCFLGKPSSPLSLAQVWLPSLLLCASPLKAPFLPLGVLKDPHLTLSLHLLLPCPADPRGRRVRAGEGLLWWRVGRRA